MSKDGFKDKVKGAANKAKGEAKEQWGKLTDDAKKQAEGKIDKAKGDLQEKLGKSKDKAEDK